MNKLFKVIFFVLVIMSLFIFGSVKAETDVESENHDTTNDLHRTCIHFINAHNGSTLRKSCASQGVSGTKSYTHNVTEFTEGGTVYKLDGWYNEDGEKVSSTAKVSVSYTVSSEKCENIKFYLRWNAEKAPILHFNYIDNVSTGSGSWSNTNGSTADYSHTFSEPESQNHYSFAYWAIGDDHYNDGDVFTYSFKDKEPNTEETVNAFAYWQSSVTLNLYDGETLLDSKEDFEKVSINYTPAKPGYNFVGCVDEDGNEVSEDTFYPYDISSDKIDPKVVNLYATWERIKVDITINKKWDDNNNSKKLRPDKICVNLYSDGVLYDKYTITKDMNWTYTVSLFKYLEDGTLINYSIDEDSISKYIASINDFDILNTLVYEEEAKSTDYKRDTLKETTDTVMLAVENPQTGDNIIVYIILSVLSITGLVSLGIYQKI